MARRNDLPGRSFGKTWFVTGAARGIGAEIDRLRTPLEAWQSSSVTTDGPA